MSAVEQLYPVLDNQEFIQSTPDFVPEEWVAEYTPEQLVEVEHDTPLAIAVPETAEDAYTREKAAEFIGRCLAGREVEVSDNEVALETQPIESLHVGIQLAAEGDPAARSMVKTNVLTDFIERSIKTGHVIKVDLSRDKTGKIQQYGQSMESVQANSLRMAADTWQVMERTEVEATNTFRIDHRHQKGDLKDHSLVVFSRAADNMSKSEMEKVGFFTDTMSCAIQVTSADGDTLTTESAFVSGVRSKGEERHDAETIVTVGEKLGVDLKGKTATEVLDTPILVPNSLLKNGVVDLVKMYDDAAGGTFFGESRERQDYVEYKQVCKEREEMLEPKVEEVVEKLIAEAPYINGPVQAVKRLHKLSEEAMVEQAIGDSEINPLVFGEVAAVHIIEARRQLEMGNTDEAVASMHQAKSTAQSSSCPSAMRGMSEENAGDSSNHENADKYGSLTFECTKGHKNTRPRGMKISKCGTFGCTGSVGC